MAQVADYLQVNLGTISTLLGMSESLAGVTFLALGNGSPDVFSTFAAISTHSGSLAVGELIGAAGFITAVVAGSMALVRPFKVAKRSFVRDVGFFIVAASISLSFLADGRLTAVECIVMVSFYVFYVITVVVWHWYLSRRRRARERDSQARGHFLVPDGNDHQAHEEVDDETAGMNRSRTSSTLADFSILEGNDDVLVGEGDEDDNTRDRYMAEISRNMRVNRPSGHRKSTGNPIRPSLLGALEFRAVLSSLEKSRSQQQLPIHLRRYSDDPRLTLGQQQDDISRSRSTPHVNRFQQHKGVAGDGGLWPHGHDSDPTGRTRAVSVNDLIGGRQQGNLQPPQIDLLSSSPPDMPSLNPPPESGLHLVIPSQSAHRIPVSAPAGLDAEEPEFSLNARTPSIHLEPPQPEPHSPADGLSINKVRTDSGTGRLTPGVSRQSTNLSTMSQATGGSSPAMPFPAYHDDPNFIATPSRASSLRLPPPSASTESIFPPHGAFKFPVKPIRWWPYKLLPPPQVLGATLFPTLYTWKQKNFGEKLLGLMAAPSIFLITITLPVVEVEKDDDDDVPESTIPAQGVRYTDTPHLEPLIPGDGEPTADGEPSRSIGRKVSTEQRDITANPEQRGILRVDTSQLDPLASDTSVPTPLRYNDRVLSEVSVIPPPSSKDWNRWLVSVQVFLAPLFVALIVWANTDDDLSLLNLLKLCAYAMIGSLVVLAALLLTTTEEKPPRYRSLLCFVGFVVSVAWISTIANEVVGVLKALGVILGISDAILGLTIFAVGNR